MFFRSLAASLLLCAAPMAALAGLSDCQDVYVGRIWVQQGSGLHAVVLIGSPGDSSGSYWIYFTNWTAEERRAALATLTAAKMAGHRVHVTTTHTSGCGITSDATHGASVFLATNP